MFTNITIKYTADNVEETTQTYESISLADLKTAIKTINDNIVQFYLYYFI